MGLGHRRQRTSPGILEALWLGLRLERAHSSDHAKGGRQRHVPHGFVHSVSSTGTGHGAVARPHESARGSLAQRAGHLACELRARQPLAGDRRFSTVVIQWNAQLSINISKEKKGEKK